MDEAYTLESVLVEFRHLVERAAKDPGLLNRAGEAARTARRYPNCIMEIGNQHGRLHVRLLGERTEKTA